MHKLQTQLIPYTRNHSEFPKHFLEKKLPEEIHLWKASERPTVTFRGWQSSV